jgi:hypothetical protein
LCDNLLPIASNAFNAFGFITARNAEEERQLEGLYVALLKESQNPQSIFQELLKAIETNTLVNLFDIKEYAHFRQIFPVLECFLKTLPAKRITVWRLKQFINNGDNTEPPQYLQRDYGFGFKFCRQREEVERLKGYYAQVLNEVGPVELHNACIHGHLHEFATLKGVCVNMKDTRLMRNDWPAPCVGFDNDEGLATYRGPFFRRRLKA